MSQVWGFPIELSQVGSWLLCPLASGSSSLPSGIAETPRHCQMDPRSPGSQTKQVEPAKALLQVQVPEQTQAGSRWRAGLPIALVQLPLQTSRPEGHQIGVVHVVHTAELPVTTARPLQAPQPSGHQ